MNPAGNIFARNWGLLSCLALSALLIVMIHSRMDELPDLKKQYEDANNSLDIMVRNQAQGAELGSQLAELERLTSGLDNRLVKPDDKAANSQFFYSIEARSHAKISSLNQLESGLGNGDLRPILSAFTATGFNVSVEGRIGYVMSFLKRLENSRYFVRCNAISIKGDPVLASDAVDATLQMEVLSKKP